MLQRVPEVHCFLRLNDVRLYELGTPLSVQFRWRMLDTFDHTALVSRLMMTSHSQAHSSLLLALP